MFKKSLLPTYIIYFLDNFSFASLFPLFSTLILSNDSVLLPDRYDLMMRNMLFGALSGAFPLGAFFGAPLIGNAADFLGRKKGFFIALAGLIIGNLLTALALFVGSYFFLVFSRFFTGLFSTTLTLCHATVADLCPLHTQRVKHFGVLAAISGLSWIIALILGSSIAISPFNPMTPFLLSAGLASLNLIIVAYFYTDTAPQNEDPFKAPQTYDQVMNTFHSSNIRKLTGTLLLFSIGWLLTLQWFSGFSIEKFHIQPHQLIDTLLLIGGSWIIGSTLFNCLLVKKLRLPLIPFFGLLLLVVLLGLTRFVHQYTPFTLINILAAALAAIILSNLLNLFSISAPADSQGKILGIGQSVIAAAQFLVPMIGGMFLFGGFSHFYLFVSAIILCAFFFFWRDLNLLNNQKRN